MKRLWIYIPQAYWLSVWLAFSYGLGLGLLTNMILRAWQADAAVRALSAVPR